MYTLRVQSVKGVSYEETEQLYIQLLSTTDLDLLYDTIDPFKAEDGLWRAGITYLEKQRHLKAV